MADKDLLGIFDSGVGGFSVYKDVRKNTTADIIYFGDCARAPYGNKSEQEIVGYIREILLSLKGQGVTYFISACNSMSVFTTKALLKDVGIDSTHYFDMVSAVENIPFDTQKKVLIIGTKATLVSGLYQHILENKNVPYEVFNPSTLAGDIELGDNVTITSSVDSVIEYAVANHVDTIVYACTHYPLAHDIFVDVAKKYGWNGIYIDPALYLAEIIKGLKIKGDSISTFTASKNTLAFTECVQKFK